MTYSKLEIVSLFKKQRDSARKGLSRQYDNSTQCFAFYDGDDMLYRDTIQYQRAGGSKQKALVSFNKVQENVDAVAGFMAQNRRQAKFIARVNSNQGQQLYSKNMNAIYSFHRENENADQVEYDQDVDLLVTGVGVTETDLSYIVGNATRNPNGEILKRKIDNKVAYWDPIARQKNLIDRRFCGYYEDFDLKEALKLFQKSKADDFAIVQLDEPASEDSGYTYNPWGGLYDKIKALDVVDWSEKSSDMVRVYNHQWYAFETFYRCKNPIFEAQSIDDALFYKARLEIIAADVPYEGPENIDAKDMFTLNAASEQLVFDEKTKGKLVAEFGDLIEPVGFVRKCFYTAVMSGDHVFSWFKSVSQQDFSIQFKTGTWNNTAKMWVGMVNAMMDPQKYYNKSLTELLFTIAANSKGGVMVEEGAVEDIADFSKKWAKTDGVIVVNSGALSGGRIQQKTQGAVPTGLDNIIMLSDQAIKSAGVDTAFVGAQDKDAQSGVLYKRRIRQIISKMAKYFDAITLYQKDDARLHADLIPVWVENNQGTLVRITGEDGLDEFVQISQDMFAPEYDVTIQEAPTSSEDKEETATALGTIGSQYMSGGNMQAANALYSEAVQLMPIDGDIKQRILSALQPKGEDPQVAQLKQVIQQLQSQLTQVEMQNTQADTQQKLSVAELNKAKVAETGASAANKHAGTVKTLEDADRLNLENKVLKKGGYSNVNITI